MFPGCCFVVVVVVVFDRVCFFSLFLFCLVCLFSVVC